MNEILTLEFSNGKGTGDLDQSSFTGFVGDQSLIGDGTRKTFSGGRKGTRTQRDVLTTLASEGRRRVASGMAV